MDASFCANSRKRKRFRKSGMRLALAVIFHDIAKQLAVRRRRPDDGVGPGADSGADAILVRPAGRNDGIVRETLTDLALSEGNTGYFEYSECLAELVDSHQVEQEGNLYKISERGARNCEIVESSLPMTVRQKMEKNIKPVADELRRRAMITASHETADNVCRVHLALSDGMGEILNLQMLCGGEEQAEKLEENFRKNAEKYYTQIMELLSRDEKV